jgi:hypothetical protein
MSRLSSITLITAVCLLGACTGEVAVVTTTIGSTSSTSTSVVITTTLASQTTTTPPTTTSPTTSTTAELPSFPPERTDLTHGGDAWVVVLAASEDGDDDALYAAIAAAEDAGYNTGMTDCDFGAAQAMGLPDGHYYTVSVYLQSEADANAALAAFDARGVDGVVAVVQTFCMD